MIWLAIFIIILSVIIFTPKFSSGEPGADVFGSLFITGLAWAIYYIIKELLSVIAT
jgi:hypothetical protein